MSDLMAALQTLVDNGIHDDALDAAIENILEGDGCDDDDERRCLVALAWSREQGGKRKTDPDCVDLVDFQDHTVEIDGAEYIVVDDEEADAACKEYIENSLWAFCPSFLACQTDIDQTVFDALADKCEDANDAIESIINGSCGLDDFVAAAVGADGRGHFISHYDGEEHEYSVKDQWFYLYRVN